MIKFTVKNIESNKVLLSLMSRVDVSGANVVSLTKDDLFSDWMPSKKAGEKLLSAALEMDDVFLTNSSVDGDLGDESFSVVYAKRLFDSVRVNDEGAFVFVIKQDALKSLANISNFLFHHYTVEELRGMKAKYTLNMILSCLEIMVIRNEASLSFKYIGYLCGLESGRSEDRLFYRNVVQSCFADFSKLSKAPIEHRTLTKLNPSTRRLQNFALKLNSPWLGLQR